MERRRLRRTAARADDRLVTAQHRSSSMWAEHDIPPLPAAHAQAIALLGDRDIEVRALSEVVESDAALTTAVLRAANSALSAPSHPMTTARNAIVRIGLDATLNVVSGAIVHATFRDLHRATLDVGELWRHVIATALLADAEAVSRGEQTEAFTAGLLHDVGRLSMAAQEPLQYAAAVALMRGGTDAVVAETQIFGFSHVEWGVRVAPGATGGSHRHAPRRERGRAGVRSARRPRAVREARHWRRPSRDTHGRLRGGIGWPPPRHRRPRDALRAHRLVQRRVPARRVALVPASVASRVGLTGLSGISAGIHVLPRGPVSVASPLGAGALYHAASSRRCTPR